MANLSTKSARDRLPARREPYWLKLESRRFLGYRVTPHGAFWIARCHANGRQHFNSLGSAAALPVDAAKRAAEQWFQTFTGSTGVNLGTTVADAFRCYADSLDSDGRPMAAAEARQRSALVVEKDRLGGLRLDRIQTGDVAAWRDRLRPGRTPATVNRYLRTLKAALSRAVKLGHAGNPDAWRNVDAIRGAERSRDTFLDLHQRRALLAASPAPLRALLTGLMITGARPGELMRATVSDLDVRSGTITLKSLKGRGAKLRIRAFPLTPDALHFFQNATNGRQPSEPLLLNADGRPWQRSNLAGRVRVAANVAGLPAGVVAYTLRHSAISEWLNAGVDPVTCGKLAGTSVAMIERHYHKLMPAVLDRLSAIAVV